MCLISPNLPNPIQARDPEPIILGSGQESSRNFLRVHCLDPE